MLDFLQKNEDRFSDWDRLRLKGFRWTLGAMSNELRRQALYQYAAPYGMTGVWAGETEAVHHQALARVFQQYAVPVKGQSDILIVGVPYVCPYNVNSIMNPVLVQCTGLGYLFNMFRNKPLVKPGGTMIVCHPLRDEFHPEHHPSYIEFFHRCLGETTDSLELKSNSKPNLPAIQLHVHVSLRPCLPSGASVLHVVLGPARTAALCPGDCCRMPGTRKLLRDLGGSRRTRSMRRSRWQLRRLDAQRPVTSSPSASAGHCDLSNNRPRRPSVSAAGGDALPPLREILDRQYSADRWTGFLGKVLLYLLLRHHRELKTGFICLSEATSNRASIASAVKS